jgi:hypothetical protein
LAVRRLRQLPRADGVRVALDLLAAGRGRGVGGRSRGQVSVLMFNVAQACSGIETHLRTNSRALPLLMAPI